MNCIFCHETSDNSKSIEHIIPESLGNKKHTLWKGAVCDKCNNYFATKIEKPLLEQSYFVSVRHNNIIKTKKGNCVHQSILFSHPNKGFVKASLGYDDNGIKYIIPECKEEFEYILSGTTNQFRVIEHEQPTLNNYILSRFLAKCAFEYLAFILVNGEKSVYISEAIEFLQEKQFDDIRKYARYGEGTKFWKYSQRRIYDEDAKFIDKSESNSNPYKIIHEMCLFVDESTISKSNDRFYAELYFVLVIMGIEYVINVSDDEVQGYENWLKNNNNVCPTKRGTEKMLDSGIADVFPLLIKHTNDR